MKKSYTIKDLVFLMLGHIWWIIAAAIVGAAGTFGVSRFVIPKEYQSNISMYVKNSENQEQQQQGINNNDLTVSKSLVSTYIVILNNDVVMDKVGTELLKQYSEEELQQYFTVKDGKVTDASLKSCFQMTAVDQTEVLKITATTKNAKLSSTLCNIMADVAPDFLIRVVGAGSVEKIGDAKVYDTPVSPNVMKNTAIGFAAGIMLAILVILVIDFFDNTVKDTAELNEKFQKPIIGEIQNIGGKIKKKDRGTSADRKRKLIYNNQDIPFNILETYKSFRSSLNFLVSTSENKIVAVTSSNPSEGKSVTIANLATAMSETDKKILLIDADMRKPVQHKNFHLSNKIGLSNVITDSKLLDEAMHKQVIGNLDILTAGTIPPNPSELLASKQMAELLDKLKTQYDMILMDCAPINIVSDVAGLASSIAGVVMVVHYGITTFAELEDAQKQLGLANCNILGFVLNEVQHKHGTGYYSNYKYKYRYKYNYNYRYGSEKTAASPKEDAPERVKDEENADGLS